MNEFLYDVEEAFIALGLIVMLYGCMEICFRYGRYLFTKRPALAEHVYSSTSACGGAVLGSLALLLGFAFAMSVQRFDTRKSTVIEEANDIQTAYLRTEFLPEHEQAKVQQYFRDYLEARIHYSKAGATDDEIRSAMQKTAFAQAKLWKHAVISARDTNKPEFVGYYVDALNRVLDDQTKRAAARTNHVPEAIIWLLIFVSMLALGVVGFAAGLKGRRLLMQRSVLILATVATLTIIVDLDRPRRGMIQVDQSLLENLRPFLAQPPIPAELNVSIDGIAPRK